MASYLAQVIAGKFRLPHCIEVWQKYSALNPRPILYNDHTSEQGQNSGSGKGSVEFRHLEGTYNLDRIIRWINIILSLQAASRRYSPDYIEERVTEMGTRTDYMQFQEDIFGSLLPAPTNFNEILRSSIAYAKECYCPVPSISEIVKSAKSSGLQQMIRLRSRSSASTSMKKKVGRPFEFLSWHSSLWNSTNFGISAAGGEIPLTINSTPEGEQ
jgi:hypothetical protein